MSYDVMSFFSILSTLNCVLMYISIQKTVNHVLGWNLSTLPSPKRLQLMELLPILASYGLQFIKLLSTSPYHRLQLMELLSALPSHKLQLTKLLLTLPSHRLDLTELLSTPPMGYS